MASQRSPRWPAWRDHPVTPLLHWWWGLWILASLLSYTSFSRPADLAETQSRAVRGAVGDVVLAATCSLALLVVTRPTGRQEALAGRKALSQSRRWLYATRAVSRRRWSCSVSPSRASRPSTTQQRKQKPSKGGSASSDSAAQSTLATDLALGDCFNEPSDANTSNEKFTLLAVNVVPCGQSHDEEVVGYIAYPAGPDVAFPGDDARRTRRRGMCPAFEDWVGRPLAEMSLEMGYPWPLQDSWDAGERGILCVAYQTGGSRLVGSVRNTAL